MGKRRGNDFLLYVVDGSVENPIAGLTANGLTINGETIDVTTKDSGAYTEKLAGALSWGMSGEGNYDDEEAFGFDYLFDLMAVHEPIVVRTSSEKSGIPYYEGNALITSLERSHPLNDKVAFTITLEGSGELDKVGS